MIEAAETAIQWLADLLVALMNAGGYIGAFIVLWGLFVRLVHVVRTIFTKP